MLAAFLSVIGVLVVICLGIGIGIWVQRTRAENRVLRDRLSFTPDRNWSQIPGGDPRENLPPEFSPPPAPQQVPSQQRHGNIDRVVVDAASAVASAILDRFTGGRESRVGGRQEQTGVSLSQFRLSMRAGRPFLEYARNAPAAALRVAHKIRQMLEDQSMNASGILRLSDDGQRGEYNGRAFRVRERNGQIKMEAI